MFRTLLYLSEINTKVVLTYPAMHEQEGTIQLSAAMKCPK